MTYSIIYFTICQVFITLPGKLSVKYNQVSRLNLEYRVSLFRSMLTGGLAKTYGVMKGYSRQSSEWLPNLRLLAEIAYPPAVSTPGIPWHSCEVSNSQSFSPGSLPLHRWKGPRPVQYDDRYLSRLHLLLSRTTEMTFFLLS